MKTYPGTHGPETQEVMAKLFPQTKLQKAKAEVDRLWNLMCNEESVPVNAKFVVFTSTNKYAVEYNNAVKKFFRLKSNASPAKLSLLYSPKQWKQAVR